MSNAKANVCAPCTGGSHCNQQLSLQTTTAAKEEKGGGGRRKGLYLSFLFLPGAHFSQLHLKWHNEGFKFHSAMIWTGAEPGYHPPLPPMTAKIQSWLEQTPAFYLPPTPPLPPLARAIAFRGEKKERKRITSRRCQLVMARYRLEQVTEPPGGTRATRVGRVHIICLKEKFPMGGWGGCSPGFQLRCCRILYMSGCNSERDHVEFSQLSNKTSL